MSSIEKLYSFNMGKYHAAVGAGKLRYANLDAARIKASEIKRHTLANLPQYLEEFEKNCIQNGITVLWAQTAADAIQYITNILQEHKVTSVVKSKSYDYRRN
jgi:L-lactate dehydrogenase complex protein LldF